MNYNHLLDQVKDHIRQFFDQDTLVRLSYHSLAHTRAVVSHAEKIAGHYELSEEQTFIVLSAAWFHDTGYFTGEAAGHEQRGAAVAAGFLHSIDVPEHIIKEVSGCIVATQLPQRPSGLLQEIVCDADLFHLGTPEFGDWNKLVRKEAEQRSGKKIDKAEWRKSTIRLLEEHDYHTEFCRRHLDKQKKKNLEKLRQKAESEPVEAPELLPAAAESVPYSLPAPEFVEGKKAKNDRPDKGIETMFRISSNNHQRLSDMADNKAQIMITTTSIIISVLLSVLIRRLEDNAYLTIPTITLLTVCMITMVFSILATRPTIPQGTFTHEEIESKNVNLLFFGNFYRMSYEEYSSGMQAMMGDRDFLYGSLTKDVYSQGVVLGKKYRLLRIAYNVFMFGIVVSVLAFLVASVFFGR